MDNLDEISWENSTVLHLSQWCSIFVGFFLTAKLIHMTQNKRTLFRDVDAPSDHLTKSSCELSTLMELWGPTGFSWIFCFCFFFHFERSKNAIPHCCLRPSSCRFLWRNWRHRSHPSMTHLGKSMRLYPFLSVKPNPALFLNKNTR